MVQELLIIRHINNGNQSLVSPKFFGNLSFKQKIKFGNDTSWPSRFINWIPVLHPRLQTQANKIYIYIYKYIYIYILYIYYIYVYIYLLNITNIYTFENKNHDHQLGRFLCTWYPGISTRTRSKRLLKLVKLHACKWKHCPGSGNCWLRRYIFKNKTVKRN